ncbi:CDP-glucose 4,6-dehydratase [Criblamydia sequanensis]|uniref:CDP-glucose 4,6-dehydratase n=1 Tax=Candidatus Criblamydia sequanensis CRIB-18 TaxID=1437425 RepID=A0A090CZS4_9BACT|nr:CDP-glucose 4,6-dehydratase [Criblamydia sequanensis]CDR34491.1 CDP-glucose 4,6-dehydratase [Criblamydia sequanensis CRIB-18]
MIEEIRSFYKGKKVLVTGHTGFKGSWLTLWLTLLKADVTGFSLGNLEEPNLFSLLKLEKKIDHRVGDITHLAELEKLIQSVKPDIVFHLAAEALVFPSFQDPVKAFNVNAMGSINLLQALKGSDSKAALFITTDKVYENKNWDYGYREIDSLGGKDPYSASKAMSELAVRAYRESFKESMPALATARAGNIIGGGDFSKYRLLPDCFRSLSRKEPILIRSPNSVRPWLYVLDALFGYLLLGKKLIEQPNSFSDSFNFGPLEIKGVTAKELAQTVINLWGNGSWIQDPSFKENTKEMKTLRLSFDKAAEKLSWKPSFSWIDAVKETTRWYREFYDKGDVEEVSISQIESFYEQAAEIDLSFARSVLLK